MARRLASLAIVAGLAAAVLVVVAAPDADASDATSDDSGWVLGLLLILAPLLCAAITRAVVLSSRLRPVGTVAVVVCALAALVHVGFAGALLGAPAVACAVLLAAAVISGPVIGPAPHLPRPDAPVFGPPLDVLTPLRDARAHAGTAVAAWLVVLLIGVVATPVALRLLGWPTVVESLDVEVVAVGPRDDDVAVTFEAQDGGRRLRWTRELDESSWRVGDRRTMYLDDDGRVHPDQQFGLAGVPLFMPVLFVGLFTGLATRRWWGLVVAVVDATTGADVPRLGYVAVIDDPAPKTLRPLVAVWERDPVGDGRLGRADAVFRADDETGDHLQSRSHEVVVRRAWIDTGLWRHSKPRWIGVEDGVVVPHRRSLFGRWYVRTITRRGSVGDDVVALRHGPPMAEVAPSMVRDERRRHRLRGMVAWRLLALVTGVVLALVSDHEGDRVEVERRERQRGGTSASPSNP